MAGSLQRPSFNIISTYKCNTTEYKSIIKLQKQRLLHTKGSRHTSRKHNTSSSSLKNPQQLLQLLVHLKYCQNLSLAKLLLLLPLSFSLSSFTYDNCCWTTASTSKNKKKRNKNLTTTINYAKQHKKQQHQQQLQKKDQHHQYKKLQLQQLQFLNKLFKISKFRKNLLNRKKLPQRLLRKIQSYRKNQLYGKSF